MHPLENLHRLLRVAAMLLDGAAGQIRDAHLSPVRSNIRKVGEALAAIFESLNFKFRPQSINRLPSCSSSRSTRSHRKKLVSPIAGSARQCWQRTILPTKGSWGRRAVFCFSLRRPNFCPSTRSWLFAKYNDMPTPMTPNPSVERTPNGGPRWFAAHASAAPLAAAHVKR